MTRPKALVLLAAHTGGQTLPLARASLQNMWAESQARCESTSTHAAPCTVTPDLHIAQSTAVKWRVAKLPSLSLSRRSLPRVYVYVPEPT